MPNNEKPVSESEMRLRNQNAASPEQCLGSLQTTAHGLDRGEVGKRLREYGYNEIVKKGKQSIVLEILSKFKNPLVIGLIVIAIFSFFFGEKISAVIVVSMAVLSVVLSFIQEHKAQKNAEKLQAMVRVTARVLRSGRITEVQLKELVPGDIIELSAGVMLPADVKIISAKDLFVNQSTLNGESFPVEKFPTPQNQKTETIFDLDTIAFMGTSVANGTAQGVVVATGQHTQFGQLSKHLISDEPPTAFDVGIKKFTLLMLTLIAILCAFIFAINAITGRHSVLDSLIFALAVAVGIAPEMLPMIVTVNLSKGALRMAKKDVIIKRLDAIQNLGAMDVLCTDKTGTLTLDSVSLVRYCDPFGQVDENVLKKAYINSTNQTGLQNLLDKAVLRFKKFAIDGINKIDEIPFDFERKIMSVVVEEKGRHQLIAKGAPEEIFKRCRHYTSSEGTQPMTAEQQQLFREREAAFNHDGFRVLAIASRVFEKHQDAYNKEDEQDLIFEGFTAFLDPPKPTAREAILSLEKLGVTLKILSGDNALVNQKICKEVGIAVDKIVTGPEIDKMSDEQLQAVVEEADIFARVMPLQKERIIRALQAKKHIVGFLGDGINDSPALKAADTGISVDNAADIAKETADIILLKKSLNVLSDCVREGRRTFANTLKYIKMGASSNFGNMLSMTGASIFLPFLPMLATQILLNNFLYDLSQVTIPTDDVDEEYVEKPRPWDIKYIREFILALGPVSSIFDFTTFGIMLWVFHANEHLFQTGWFVESLFTQTFVIYIIRTHKIPFFQSRPSKILLYATLGIVATGCIIPYTPIGAWFNFVPLPPLFFLILLGIAVAYLLLAQLVKVIFVKKFGFE
ncbi:MAG: magnesium-translocating P-type ATPase [Patescibacteria group bacterium]|jgi:Mg2+-importing ATPase